MSIYFYILKYPLKYYPLTSNLLYIDPQTEVQIVQRTHDVILPTLTTFTTSPAFFDIHFK